MTKDAISGASLLTELALVYARTGRHAAALDLLERLLAQPTMVAPPLLRYDPRWQALSDEPRFQRLSGWRPALTQIPAEDRPATASHWTSHVYRRHAALFYDVEAALFQNDQLTGQELDLATELGRRVDAPVGSPVVDLACGPGRHSRELARRGFAVTGVDLSPPFLAMARAASAAAGVPPPRLLGADLRRLGLAPGSFDTALLLGNSFGYFSDEENRAILEQIRRILRPGGLLCMEITNRDAYLERFEPYQDEVVRGRHYPELRCQWWKRWDPQTRRVHTIERHSHAATGEVIYEGPYDVRLYGWRELRGLLGEAGFPEPVRAPFTPALDSLAGGLGETFGAMSEVLFVAARG